MGNFDYERNFQVTGYGFIWESGIYTFVPPPVAGQTMHFTSVNESGIVVGDINGTTAVQYRIQSHKLRLPAGGPLAAVNDHDVAVGTYDVQPGIGRTAEILRHGMVTILPLPSGAYASRLFGIDDSGTSVGEYDDQSGRHYFTYANGQTSPVSFPAGMMGTITSIGANGKLVGSAYYLNKPSKTFGLVIDGGISHIFEYPGSKFSYVIGANSRGVFGTYYPGIPYVAYSGFIKHDGIFYSLNVPTLRPTKLLAVAPNGNLVGAYVDGGEAVESFVAICAPDQQPCTK